MNHSSQQCMLGEMALEEQSWLIRASQRGPYSGALHSGALQRILDAREERSRNRSRREEL